MANVHPYRPTLFSLLRGYVGLQVAYATDGFCWVSNFRSVTPAAIYKLYIQLYSSSNDREEKKTIIKNK